MESIGIDWHILLAQLVNFGILFGILFVLLYKPVRRMLDERSARIRESMEQAEQVKEQLARTDEQVREQIEAARREGQGILAQAAQMGERLKEEARAEAKRGTPQGGGQGGGQARGGDHRGAGPCRDRAGAGRSHR